MTFSYLPPKLPLYLPHRHLFVLGRHEKKIFVLLFVLLENPCAAAELHHCAVPTPTFSSLDNSFTPAHKWRHSILTSRVAWSFPPLSGWCKSCLIFKLYQVSFLKLALLKSLRAGNQVTLVTPWERSHPKHPKIFITFCLSISAPQEIQQDTNRAVSNAFG